MRKLSVIHPLAIALLALTHGGCVSSPEMERGGSVVVRYIGGGPLTVREVGTRQEGFTKFTQQTGIRVVFVPGPESSTDRLNLYQQVLAEESSNPDVYQLDVIWPGIVAQDFVDLRPYLGEEAKQQLPAEVQNNTVEGRLIAMPGSVERGALYYRSDLLKKYGYAHPPETWDELEKMAARIQAGERQAGNKDFWGYVWEGAAYEGLTCNALEWQASQGGGRIIDEDRTITVNNPGTLRAMERARRWVGMISPASVTEYKEEDARNIFLAGNAAFRRDWIWTANITSSAKNSPIEGKVGVTWLPDGGSGHVASVGGWSYGVSKYSQHPREAAELIRYMTSRDGEREVMPTNLLLPARQDFYSDPQSFQSRPELAQLKDIFTKGAVVRPSTVTGKQYKEVSRAYFTAVHEILTGEKTASSAMGELESDLVKITGFKPKQPSPATSSTH